MAITTPVTDISEYLDLTAVYGDYAADFDTAAVQADYLAAIQDAAQQIAPSVTVHANGIVFAAIEYADAARDIDWR